MSFDEIVDELNLFKGKSKNCCELVGYICPELDKALRAADAERTRRAQYNKRLKKQGFTDADISKMPRGRGRKSISGKFEAVDISVL